MGKTEDIAAGRDVYTQSRLRSFRKCPRHHYLAYEVGLREAETKKALRMGSAFHAGQEELGKISAGSTAEERQALVQAAIVSCIQSYEGDPPGSVTQNEWDVERETVGRLLYAYAWRYAEDPIEIVAAEQVFKHPIKNVITGDLVYRMMGGGGPPERMMLYRSGMIDKIGKLQDGRIALIEHKTTGDSIKPDSDYWRRAKLSGQVTFYYLAALDSPDLPDPQLIIYDVIRKPAIEPKKLTLADHRNFLGLAYRKGKKTIVQPEEDKLHKYCGEEFKVEIHGAIDNENPDKTKIEGVTVDGAQAEMQKSGNNVVIIETPTMYGARLIKDIFDRPEMYFAREELPRLQGDLEECQADIHGAVEMIDFCRRTGQWPKNDDACINPYRCEFMSVCSNNTQITVGGKVPSGYQVIDYIHPELEHEREEPVDVSASTPSPPSPEPVAAPVAAAAVSPENAIIPPSPSGQPGPVEEDDIPF